MAIIPHTSTTQTTDAPHTASKKSTPLSIAIIGGGLTGLMSAELLERQYAQSKQAINIVIFEKSAGVGRLATRYKQPSEAPVNPDDTRQWQFDFGAQFFTAKSDLFQSYLSPYQQQKVIEPWFAKVAQAAKSADKKTYHITQAEQWGSAQPRYIARPKMTSFGRLLARTLQHTTINYKTKVAPLIHTQATQSVDKKTSLFDDEGKALGSYDWVICTAPQAQAIELFADSGFKPLAAIKKPQMLACYTLMLGWREQKLLPSSLQKAAWDILEVSGGEPPIIGRIFVEHHKPGREHLLPSVTIHASNHWAQQQVDEPIEVIKHQLLTAARDLLNWDEAHAPVYIDCHRWRYAATQLPKISETIAYVDDDKQWVVTGDWCDEGRIESCFKAANKVVDIIAG